MHPLRILLLLTLLPLAGAVVPLQAADDYVMLTGPDRPEYPAGPRQTAAAVDHVVVFKSHRMMFLMKNGQEVRRYRIELSDRSVGHKQYEGDRRTPEGTYYLDYVKDNSTYYRAFHISYPNEQDVARARSRGQRPGGMIMVHGQPRALGSYHARVQRRDWTNGCIALLNSEIDEFISLVEPGTPITINP